MVFVILDLTLRDRLGWVGLRPRACQYLVRSALLGILVVPVPVDEGHSEQGAPED